MVGRYTWLLISLLLVSCKTYLIEPAFFKSQLFRAVSIDSIPRGTDFCLIKLPKGERGIYLLKAETKDHLPFLFLSGANTEVRFTKKMGADRLYISIAQY
jgi:hypothetical protein